MADSRGGERALIVVGWIATLPGIVGLLGIAVVFTDGEIFGCRPSGIVNITCPQDPFGWLGELLFVSGLAMVIGFPATVIPAIFTVVYPIVRLIRRRRVVAG